MTKKPRSKQHSRAHRRVPASEARAMLADVLEAVGEGRERILIERRGKPPVAVVSVDDLLQLELNDAIARHHAGKSAAPASRSRANPPRARNAGSVRKEQRAR